uniref:Uncharacterized protein n=1 Tax=Anguilla anguilla TaxID=7936 RepID=A0A0E9WGD0_ANGAN
MTQEGCDLIMSDSLIIAATLDTGFLKDFRQMTTGVVTVHVWPELTDRKWRRPGLQLHSPWS